MLSGQFHGCIRRFSEAFKCDSEDLIEVSGGYEGPQIVSMGVFVGFQNRFKMI